MKITTFSKKKKKVKSSIRFLCAELPTHPQRFVGCRLDNCTCRCI